MPQENVALFRCENVLIGPRGGVFLDGGKKFLRPAARFWRQIAEKPAGFGYVLSPQGLVCAPAPRLTAIPSEIRRIDEPVFLLSTYAEDAYTHFIIDVLSRLFAWWSLPAPRPRLLISEEVYAARRCVFDALGIGVEAILLKPMQAWALSREVIVSDYPFYAAPAVIDWFQKRLFRAPPASRPRRRIYLSRHDRFFWDRAILNEADLVALLERHGFEIVNFSDMRFRDQLDALASADCIAAQFGGALFNLLLGVERKRLLVLASENYNRFHLDQANPRLQHHAVRVVCRSFQARSDPNNSAMIVDLSAVKRALELLELA